MRRQLLTSLIVVLTLSFAGAASAQVLIDMPPVKSKSIAPTPQAGAAQPLLVTAVAPISASIPAASASSPDVGDLALARYSRARMAPGDVYNDDPWYPGIRYNSYPYYYGYYPFLFWWGGFSFHGHGHCH